MEDLPKTTESTSQEISSNNSLMMKLFEEIEVDAPSGEYCTEDQTWSHREWLEFSPVKNNQEM